MAEFDKSRALGAAGGLGKLAGTWAGAYLSGPKASSNEEYLKKAGIVGNWRYGASDINGLMSQWDSTPQLQNVTGKDFFNPSSGEMFGAMFGSGMAAYGAAAGLTSELKGKLGSTPIGKVPTGKVTGDVQYSGGNAMSNSDFSQLISQGGQENVINPVSVDTSNLKFTYNNACGGHLHKCGGHKFGMGGASMDWGSGLSTALNLASAGIGIGLSYAGMKDQKRQAEMEAKEVNAMNLYARQLQQHNFDEAVTDSKNNMFNQQALQMMALGGDLYAMGGDLQTHGADYPLLGNYNIIGAGGTHEQNPLGGVFQGMAADGKPNLVEEDEVVWNDYVFSNRLTIPKDFAKERKLKKGITYAQAAQKLAKEAEERPNDSISQNGMAEALGALQISQEELKQKREAARIKREIAKMSPEEVLNMMAMIQGGQQQSQPMEQPVEQPVVEQPMYAEGGHLYPWGGYKTMFDIIPAYASSHSANYLPYSREMTKDQIAAAMDADAFKSFTKYVNDNWDSEEVQAYLKALDAKAGGNHLFDKDGKIKADAKDYYNKARMDNKWGYYHLTPQQIAAVVNEEAASETDKTVKEEESKEELKKDEGVTKEEAPAEEASAKRAVWPLQTISRYAPLLSGLGMLQGPAKDYSTAVAPRMATYAPIGDYLPYLPVDTQRYINAENQQAAAQLNAIMNASAGNRNMAMAQAALANAQRQQGIGQRMQQAEAINWDRLRQAGEFNRGTNMFNAQAHNAAEIANLQVNPLLLNQEQRNQMMRYQADKDRDEAISASLNAFLDSLGDIGRENFYFNQANSNEALRYGVDANPLFGGFSFYHKPSDSKPKKTTTETTGASSAGKDKKVVALGGYLLSKPKKNRR